uniref:Uncharacterized protein n=1 Tax=uncultured gamma proteobacterium HF0010_16J05 TaxID=710981 RepID=E0XR66_9GAMM|nr:hypothetical protein [uncultured gamma proteobacterium HF0010_16J05]
MLPCRSLNVKDADVANVVAQSKPTPDRSLGRYALQMVEHLSTLVHSYPLSISLVTPCL